MSRSTAHTRETIKWEDGKEYPLIKLEISNTSHPFYTGKMKLVDTAGRVDKFMNRYKDHKKKSSKKLIFGISRAICPGFFSAYLLTGNSQFIPLGKCFY
jgi:large subunit ribosomal protein L31